MYTVFTSGAPKMTIFGPVFVRTLAAARKHMVPGDCVTRWSNSGHASKQWVMTHRGTLTAV